METTAWNLDIGATVSGTTGTGFRVWAPKAQSMVVQLVSARGKEERVALLQEQSGYFSGMVNGVAAGDRYLYLKDSGTGRPDPASRFQPDGVHGASQVVDPRLFTWHDKHWQGIRQEEYVIYELHVGTFSREGTFDGVIPLLDYLVNLGITAVEIMPVAQCPGRRNWGYDGVYLFAPQNNYGGPDGLKRLVDACHAHGLAVILDVVYNHFGPEGNYSGEFGYYTTDRYRTPWGAALNYDGPCSDPVNDFFIANALYWLHEYHIDTLRLDSVDWIFDLTARHFLQRLAEEVHRHGQMLGKRIYLIAEYDANDARLVRPAEQGGYGIDAQWNDGFHHSLRTLLTGETTGYYEDYGQFSQLVKAFENGFVYTGEYSAFRRRRHGGPSPEVPGSRFVVFSQNHDQIGNRKCGDRLAASVSHEQLLLAAGTVLLSPYIPLLFMGEEYGETAPFHYFVDHSDKQLIEAVRRGKAEEHASGACTGDPPDPAAESTFLDSHINLTLKREGRQACILKFYRRLLALRRKTPCLQVFDRNSIEVKGFERQKTLAVIRQTETSRVLCLFCFSDAAEEVMLILPPGKWEKLLDSSHPQWDGAGELAPRELHVAQGAVNIPMQPFSLAVYENRG
ncbi:malto-oligosyltrehalose trehalohydrolase [Pelotalea chapellei]|uniref:Malto-oligosyltrehalose trehalohydrolase n=1 Tax=Pelotalea chapellei TaxID=44671 RepID=A0ABS5U9P0_9BACT|nr:malto-oligosyltrehalose trehalohydrolase [Pelotalea chapellei]MBT1072380.1 malto-oligosyltrehalose trehalohydrolase [Pelotalea chapellei]